MTLLEYIKADYVIHCETIEEAQQLAERIDQLGYMWCDHQRYTENLHYGNYDNRTCYFVNEGTYCDVTYFKDNEYEVIKYKHIDNYRYLVTNKKIQELYKTKLL